MSEIDLNEKIGKLLNLPYKTEFWVMNQDESNYTITFEHKTVADDWLERQRTKFPNSWIIKEGYHVVERHIYPHATGDLNDSKIIVDAMGKKGFWLKLVSPFIQTIPGVWHASFDFHGTVDSCPLWQAASENPAMAIVLAALKAIEGNPEIFEKEQ